MSVLQYKRTQSKAEFINCANDIYVQTITFLTRLSARYSRLIAEPTANLAGEVLDFSEKANSVFPSSEQRKDLRRSYLLQARAALMALGVRLTHIYPILANNPQGCFTKTNGQLMPAEKANERIDKLSQKLSELINKENALLTGALKAL